MAADNVIADAPAVRPAPEAASIDVGSWTRLKFIVVRGFLWAWARCFSLKGLYLFGQFFGTCEWLVNYKRRRRFWGHVDRIFGSTPERMDNPRMKWACWRHFTRTRSDKLFYLIFDKLPREKILHRVRFHDREKLDEALKRNRGAYVSMSHFGSHHVCVVLMALMGYRVAGVRDRNEGALRRYVQRRYEETFPEVEAVRMLYADAFPRDVYRCFHDGYILGSALDVGRQRSRHLRTAPVTMFGKQREFLTGTMQIALRCGAPILQGFVVSRKNFYFHLIVKGPLVDPETEADEPAILQDAMQRYADNIAEQLTAHPDHISKS